MVRKIVLLLTMLFSLNVGAQSATEEKLVRDVVQAIEDSLNVRDWKMFGSMFSEQGDLILFGSRRAVGPADVEVLIGEEWANAPEDVTAKLTPASVRFVMPDLAILTIDGDFSGSQPSKDRAIFVISKSGDEWRLEALRVFDAEAM